MATNHYRKVFCGTVHFFRTVLLLLSVFYSSGFLNAQVYGHEKIGTEIERIEKGLSQNSVRTILQDSYGFIWVGTWSGLNRFDGLNIKILSSDVANYENSLSTPVINALAEDNAYNIYVGTEGGLDKVDAKTLKVSHCYDNTKNKVLSDTVRSLFFDGSYLWIGMRQGIVIKDFNTDSLLFVRDFAGKIIKTGEVREIIELSGDVMALGTENGIKFIDRKSLTLIESLSQNILSNNSVLSLLPFNDSLLLAGTENGLNILNLNDKSNTIIYASPEKDSLTNNVIMDLMKDSDTNIWVATSGGGVLIFEYNGSNSFKFRKIKSVGINNSKEQESPEQEEYFYSLMQSRDGIIWLGSAWNGIYKLEKESNFFKKFQKSGFDKGLSDNHIWAFYNDGNDFWIGTENGVNIYNKITHKIRYIRASGKAGYRLTSNKIRSIFKDPEGNFLIGTYKGGFNKYYPSDGHIEWYSVEKQPPFNIPDNTVWHFAVDNAHNLWIATYNGLQKRNLITGETKLYKNISGDTNSLSSNVVYNLYFDKEDNLWVCTFDGLNKYNPGADNFTVFKRNRNNPKTLNTNRIFYIYQDDSLDYWIGTIGGGLNKMDYNTGEISYFTTRDGLPDNTIYAILPDDYGNLWLSTNYGISVFNIQNESFVNYTVSDGLTSNEFNFGAALKDNEGNLYFGGMSGFNVLKPKDLVRPEAMPQPVISEFVIDGGPSFYCLNNKDVVKLKHFQNSLFIRFSLMDFINPEKDSYSYKLTGINKNWKSLPAEMPVVSFSKLQPGTYHLLIKGSNSAGVWTESPADIKIVITEPWYNALWLRLLLLFIVAAMVFLIIRIRLKRIRYKQKTERQLLELERQTLRLQMNPHFIFNTLNSIQNYILKNDTDRSIGYLSKFSKLMRMMLNFSRKKIITLEEEIEMLKIYLELENLRHSRGFDFRINVSPELDIEFIGIPAMLIQPFVENAVIHGLMPLKDRKGELIVSFKQEGEFVIVSIKDNGAGRSKNVKNAGDMHKPSGMLITQKRLELINKLPVSESAMSVTDLKDENGNPAGTLVVIKILISDTEN